MSSKIIGAESTFFADLAVSAALRVRMEVNGKVKCPLSNIHILKAHGQSSLNSQLVDGYALNCTRAAQGMPTRVANAKIALLDFGLQKHKLQMGVQVTRIDCCTMCHTLSVYVFSLLVQCDNDVFDGSYMFCVVLCAINVCVCVCVLIGVYV